MALIRPVDLSAEGALVTLTLLVGGWVLGNGTRERRERHASDLVAAQQRAELERRLAEQERDKAAQQATAERLRITRELHDVIGHAMSVMVVQAGVAERLLDTSPGQAREAIQHISATGRGSLTEMRRLLDVIGEGDPGAPAPRDPAPTLADLPALVTRVTRAGLPVELDVVGQPGPLSPGQELAVYRVVQEALTNCLKHAGASRADVHLRHEPDWVEVTVEDDSVFGAAPASPGPGRGLTGMRERVAIYGGDLSAGAVAMIRVVVADDQELVRSGFALILGSDPGIEVVAQAGDGAQALAAARQHLPDVVLMDIRMPGMDGIEATRHLTSSPRTAGIKVLVLTTFDADEYVVDALRAGASGFVLKDTTSEDLIHAVSVVASGEALLLHRQDPRQPPPHQTRRPRPSPTRHARPPRPPSPLTNASPVRREPSPAA